MSVHYILDGYNIIKQVPFLADMTLQRGRESFLRILENERPQGSRKNKITVVFDGQAGVTGGHQTVFVHVIFTCDETADEKIKRLVTDQRNKKNLVVVTNDRALRYYVRALGASVERVNEFLGRLEGGRAAAGSADRQAGAKEHKDISHTVESRINAELERIWLNKK